LSVLARHGEHTFLSGWLATCGVQTPCLTINFVESDLTYGARLVLFVRPGVL
jgi:hypothetical protein